MATSAIDLSGGLVPKQSNIDLSAGFVPRDQPENSHWYTGVGDTLGREASTMRQGLNPVALGRSAYHAFADPATEEETQEAGGSQEVSGAKRIGLGLGRLTAEPLVNAVRWYRDAAQGKVPDPVGQALSVAPEAMGTGGAAVVSGKLAEMAPGATRNLATTENLTAPVRMAARSVKAVGDIPGVGSTLKHLRDAAYVNTPVEDIPRFEMPGQNFGLKQPVFSKVRLGPEAPPPEVGHARGLGGYVTPDVPASSLGKIPVAPAPRAPLVDQIRSLPQGQYEAPASPLPPQGQLGEGIYEGEYMEEPPTPPPTIRGALPRGQYAAPASSLPPPRQLGPGTPAPRLVDQIMQRTTEAEPNPRLVDQIKENASPELSRPVTENPVVGSLVRAMQKSGLPIAKRPNLLLKGSGRVNRILGPDEDLSGALTDSLRQAKRQREQ